MSAHEMADNQHYINTNTKGVLLFAYYNNDGELKFVNVFNDNIERTLDELVAAFSAVNLEDQIVSTMNRTPSRSRSRSINNARINADSTINDFLVNGEVSTPISTPT